MTPRKLDHRSVTAKLALMRRLLRHLTSLGDISAESLAADFGTQLVVERILTQLVDLAAAINSQVVAAERGEAPDGYGESFRLAAEVGLISRELANQLAPSAGLRNILTHAYADLDKARFVAAVPMAREQYAEYIRQVASWLRERV
jgi:uncharacterized protein YutE (UPF0331/DUF86 family)